MSSQSDAIHLPAYQTFLDTIAVLALPISASELHGLMCGYLCAGATSEGETYLRALTPGKRDVSVRTAALAMFEVYSISQHQLANFDFEFQLLLPDEHESLVIRAQAFSEWCEGFTQGMALSGIGYEQLHDEESQEALQHLGEFAHLDYETLEIDEEDEKALMEVQEYTRMAVIRLHSDLISSQSNEENSSETRH
ncbi:UPF0149 family protein [Legionella fairfieldensis]|uniref:UPF0149 family protein n=1 Tax=Legionella fairfieldensis TaxID=45064 RepID=UPI00048B6044|nr:YecA family protein [Legionella fairfieldensis]